MNLHETSRAHAILVTCIVAPIITSLFVLLRVWTRAYVVHSVGWDDYVAIITLVFCITFSILEGIATKYGMGWHEREMAPEIHADYYKWIYISSTVYLCSLFGYKQTILLLYLRLFSVKSTFTYFTWAVMFFVFGYLFSNFWTQLFGCSPPAKFWNQDIPGQCFNARIADLVYGSMNIASDFFIMILPLPIIWNLQLSRKGKVGISLVFLSGALACAVAIIRFNYVLRDLFSVDRSWDAGRTFLWSVLEINTGLICSCTPSFKPFFNHLVSRPFFQRYAWRSRSAARLKSTATARVVAMSQESSQV